MKPPSNCSLLIPHWHPVRDRQCRASRPRRYPPISTLRSLPATLSHRPDQSTCHHRRRRRCRRRRPRGRSFCAGARSPPREQRCFGCSRRKWRGTAAELATRTPLYRSAKCQVHYCCICECTVRVLIGRWHHRKVWIARVNRRTASEQRVRHRQPAVIGQWGQQRIKPRKMLLPSIVAPSSVPISVQLAVTAP